MPLTGYFDTNRNSLPVGPPEGQADSAYWKWDPYTQQFQPTQAYMDLQQNGDPSQGTDVYYGLNGANGLSGPSEHLDPSSTPVTSFLTAGSNYADTNGMKSTNDPTKIAELQNDARVRGNQGLLKVAALVGGGAAAGYSPWSVGGGNGLSYGTGTASSGYSSFGSVAPEAAGETTAGSLTAGAETLGNGLAAHPFLSGLNALAGGSGGSMGITDWLNLGNTVLGAAAANRAGNIQSGATDAANAEIRREFDINQGNAAPYQAAGVKALGNLADPNASFQASPDYAFRRSEGQRDIGNSFAARGGAFSGNALKALDQYNSSLASGEFGNWWNRQAGLAGVGQTANGQIGVLGQNASNNIAGNTIAGGDARASGLLNTAGVLAGGARNGIGNYLYRTAPYQPYGGYGGYSPYQGYGG